MPKVVLQNTSGNIDVTQMIGDITWSGSEGEVARKLEINFLYPLHDHYAPKVYPNIGDKLYLYDDNGVELFQGKVFYNERLNQQGTIQITAYDDAIRLSKSKGTYNFKGKTAEAITHIVCNDLGVEVGELAQTGISQKMLCNRMGMYEIIKQAYEGASSQNKKKYHVEMRQGKLYVDEIGKQVLPHKITSDTNILESSYSLNAENVVSRVKIYDENDQYVGVVEDNRLIEQLGVFQDVYVRDEAKQVGTVASNMLQEIEENIELTVLGRTAYTTGNIVQIEDSSTKVVGLFCIEGDSHKWSEGKYKVTMTMSAINNVCVSIKYSNGNDFRACHIIHF